MALVAVAAVADLLLMSCIAGLEPKSDVTFAWHRTPHQRDGTESGGRDEARAELPPSRFAANSPCKGMADQQNILQQLSDEFQQLQTGTSLSSSLILSLRS